MSKVKDYIIEKRVALAKYTDIKYSFALNRIYYNCVSKLKLRLFNELEEFVKIYFKEMFNINVNAFTFSIDECIDNDYLIFANSLNYSITLTDYDKEAIINLIGEDIDFDASEDDVVIYKDVIDLYDFNSSSLYDSYKPKSLAKIHEDILNEYNDKVARIKKMSVEQIICSVCGAPNIDYVLVDQNNRVYDLRKCRLDE